MKFKFLVEASVDFICEPNERKGVTKSDVAKSVRDGIDEALNHAENRGFNHGLSDIIGVHIEKVSLAKKPRPRKQLWECPECNDRQLTSAHDMNIVGTPYCGNCDCDMKFVRYADKLGVVKRKCRRCDAVTKDGVELCEDCDPKK